MCAKKERMTESIDVETTENSSENIQEKSTEEEILPTKLPKIDRTYELKEFRDKTANVSRMDPRLPVMLSNLGIDYLLNNPQILGNQEKFHIILDINNTLLQVNSENTVKLLRKPVEADLLKIIIRNDPCVLAQRQGLNEFLELLIQFSELYVYTNSNPEYTSEIIKIIDPNQKYFKNRVF